MDLNKWKKRIELAKGFSDALNEDFYGDRKQPSKKKKKKRKPRTPVSLADFGQQFDF